ncbi:hypothetical protein F0562_016319 [Nyssa sinensis]|uniref:Uncharacterized protein n=1 Tax=Nyssa sinensis TaxID=561372 RepID=A0A5J4ZP33_9ASTE|nr:hypothetical protein F0562_016319 [Nyssa sinensis]
MHLEMKERQRWRAEEDSLLRAYVIQYGPREWNLVSQRMNTPLNRDAKSCLERWKNYLKPGIKKGSLTEEEQHLVICLQAKHGNKWKKIAAEVPGRTAKRLGKWWEVFKEKQQREQKENNKVIDPIEEGKYDRILETFAEKLVKERPAPAFLMATSNGSFLRSDPPAPPPPNSLPPWLSNSTATSAIRPPSPSVTLSLSPSTIPPSPAISWLQPDRGTDNNRLVLGSLPPHGAAPPCGENLLISELAECCRELEEGHRALAAHKNEAAWREEQNAALDRIEGEYKEQLAGLRRDAEAKEQKLAEQWAAKHLRLTKFLEQMGCRPRLTEPNGR